MFRIAIAILSIILVSISIILINTKEKFNVQPSNVFTVKETGPKIDNKKIIDGIKIPFQKNDLYEVSKDTFEYKDRILSILKGTIQKPIVIFENSLSSIFVSRDNKLILFDIILYDSIDFFAQKIRVYIKDFMEVTLSEIPSESLNEKVLPNRSELEPSYHRILNTLHLSAPFKTTDYYNL